MNAPSYLSLPADRSQHSTDSQFDGDRSVVVTPASVGKPEFPASTEVVYVNGIATDMAAARTDAAQYADLVHGPVRLIHAATAGGGSDIETCALEKLGFANNPPERAVMNEVLAHMHGATFDGDVHFAAHSRGALIVQRGLEMLEQHLVAEHLSKPEIANALNHISVETFGGASVGMPPGVRCVNYVSPEDSVANVFGMGTPSSRDTLELGAAGASLGLLGVALDAKIYADREGVRPNGPIVAVPVIPPTPHEGQIPELLENHAIGHYLAHREPFAQTYEQWHDRRVHAAVEGLRGNGSSVPPVSSVEPWKGTAGVGSFVQLEDGNVAMHAGRGKYVTFDVANDLGGSLPPLGRTVAITSEGALRDDDRSATMSR